MDPGKVQLLTECDFVLSHCGRPQPPQGSVVYIPKGFLIQAVLPTTDGQTFYKEITGDTTWCWRSISIALSATPPAVSAQVMTPEGKMLFNGLLDLTTVSGFGSGRYSLSREIQCPPGTKIQLSLEDSYLAAASQQPVAMLCGGAYAYYLRGGRRGVDLSESAARLPRVFGTTDQNTLAPCWMQGIGPSSAGDGFPYIYGNGVSNLVSVTIGSNLSGSGVIPIKADSDFLVRRFLADVTLDDGVTAGTFLVRIRAGSGYVFTDDYVNLSQFIASQYFLKPWTVKALDSIYFDCFAVDTAGSGSLSLALYADGVRVPRGRG